MGRLAAVVLATSLVFLSSCSAATLPGACHPIAPRTLPSGAVPGLPRVKEVDGTWRVTWASGIEEITQAIGRMGEGEGPAGLLPEQEPNAVVRGQAASVIPIGDPPGGEIAIEWSVGPCSYTVWVRRGLTLDDAIEYAERY